MALRPQNLIFTALATLGLSAAQAAPAPGLTVVELFQSQGCSSCPPAEANVNALAGRGEVLALNFGVTYWDYLGWRDRFAQPAFTERQRDYAAHRADPSGVYTPQVVVNGRAVLIGNVAGELNRAVAQAGPLPAPSGLKVVAGRVMLGARPASALVWLVRYDPALRQVPIGAGENSGRTLPQRDIVRELVLLGTWHGAGASFALPPAQGAGLATALLVQAGRGGPLVAATRL